MGDSKMTTEVYKGQTVFNTGAFRNTYIVGIEGKRNAGLVLMPTVDLPRGGGQTIHVPFEVISLGNAKYREFLEPFLGTVTTVEAIHEATQEAIQKKTMLFLKKNYVLRDKLHPEEIEEFGLNK